MDDSQTCQYEIWLRNDVIPTCTFFIHQSESSCSVLTGQWVLVFFQLVGRHVHRLAIGLISSDSLIGCAVSTKTALAIDLESFSLQIYSVKVVEESSMAVFGIHLGCTSCSLAVCKVRACRDRLTISLCYMYINSEYPNGLITHFYVSYLS